MKIRKEEKDPIEYVKMEKCPDCGDVVIRTGGEEVNGAEFLANDWKLVEVERDEINLLNEFLSEAAHRLRVGWDFIAYTIDKDIEKMMEEEDEEEKS